MSLFVIFVSVFVSLSLRMEFHYFWVKQCFILVREISSTMNKEQLTENVDGESWRSSRDSKVFHILSINHFVHTLKNYHGLLWILSVPEANFNEIITPWKILWWAFMATVIMQKKNVISSLEPYNAEKGFYFDRISFGNVNIK